MKVLEDWLHLQVDGEVAEGQSHIEKSMLTIEPVLVLVLVLVAKAAGDEVSAGNVNGKGTLVFRATRVGANTRFGHITEQVADRVSSIFVPTVMIIVVLMALACFNFGAEPRVIHMLVTATMALITAYPYALELATPIST